MCVGSCRYQRLNKGLQDGMDQPLLILEGGVFGIPVRLGGIHLLCRPAPCQHAVSWQHGPLAYNYSRNAILLNVL